MPNLHSFNASRKILQMREVTRYCGSPKFPTEVGVRVYNSICPIDTLSVRCQQSRSTEKYLFRNNLVFSPKHQICHGKFQNFPFFFF